MVWVVDKPSPTELGVPRGIEHAPIHADAAFVGLPWLVDGLNDIVVDAISLGASDEIAQHGRLLDTTRLGLEAVVPRARPAEFRDHDALAWVDGAQLVVVSDGFVDHFFGRDPDPVFKDMRSDEIDRGSELRMVPPDRPDFTRGNRDWAHPLYALNERLEFVDRLVRPQRGLVTDHDGVDVAVATSERDGGLDFPLVAGFILVDPDAEGDLEPELRSNRGYELTAASRTIGTNGVGIWTEDLQIGADLLRRRAVPVVRMLGRRIRRIGNARERSVYIGDRLLPLEKTPQAGMHADDERHHSSDGAHRTTTTRGRRQRPAPVP